MGIINDKDGCSQLGVLWFTVIYITTAVTSKCFILYGRELKIMQLKLQQSGNPL